eukprot:TRINITY_DN60050_c0_g1_i1.p1 TRINITY_DN60050_c0_g1~~TRINITY_DN60050_c0_g1_i1.p1  ORF type:complete len:222 (-),score=7.93 TRINITY_DN60050_c0_g1_i1:269-934(-)
MKRHADIKSTRQVLTATGRRATTLSSRCIVQPPPKIPLVLVQIPLRRHDSLLVLRSITQVVNEPPVAGATLCKSVCESPGSLQLAMFSSSFFCVVSLVFAISSLLNKATSFAMHFNPSSEPVSFKDRFSSFAAIVALGLDLMRAPPEPLVVLVVSHLSFVFLLQSSEQGLKLLSSGPQVLRRVADFSSTSRFTFCISFFPSSSPPSQDTSGHRYHAFPWRA